MRHEQAVPQHNILRRKSPSGSMNMTTFIGAVALTAWLVLGMLPVHAATLQWDVVDGNGAVDDGDGTWDTSTANFTDDGGTSNVAWNNTTNAGDTAEFGAGGGTGTVTVASGIQAGSLSILADYDFVSGSITLDTGEIFVDSGVAAGLGGGFANNADLIGTAGLVKTGAGSFSMGDGNGAQHYTGGTFVNAGKVRINNDRPNTENVLAGTGDVYIGDTSGAADATFEHSDGDAWNFPNNIVVRAGSSGTATLEQSGGVDGNFSGTLTLNKSLTYNRLSNNGGDVTFSGDISGPGDLILDPRSGFLSRNKTAHVTLSGDNSNYEGMLTFDGNQTSNKLMRLSLDGTQGNSNITIEHGPVDGTGTLMFNVENGVSDLITLNNDATLDLSGLSLEPVIGGSHTPGEFAITSRLTGVSGSFASVIDNNPSYNFTLDYDGTDTNPDSVVLITAIPEPTSLALLVLGLAGLLLGHRRRLE